MTRCAKFHHLFDEVGDFCGMSPSAISQYKAYREQVKKLVNLGIDEDFVFENFPEGPGRILSAIKDDDARTNALNYVVACLKRKEKVTEGDLRATLKGWSGGDQKPCSVNARSEKFTNVKSSTPKTEEKTEITDVPSAPIAGDLKKKYTPPENKPAPTPESIPPVVSPCDDGLKCDLKYFKNEIIRGKVCTNANMRITELPGNVCPFESDLRKRKEAAAEAGGFTPAGDIDPTNSAKFVRMGPVKVVKAPMEILFKPSPKQQEFIERMVKSGEFETPEEVVSEALDTAMLQEGGA